MSIVLNGTTGITTPDLDTDGLTSNGIDDNATSTAMTLDASGNLLLGTTGTNWTTTAGLYAFNQSALNVTRNGAESMNLNRLTSDGDIIKLYKSGTTVGSIGSEGGDALYIQAGTTSGNGLLFTSNGTSIRPARNGATIHDTLDLGSDTRSFKDLYLSGGVYLGGTGSANYLSDYEEGNWTPSPQSGAWSVDAAQYTKVGRLVTCSFRVTATVGGTGGDIQGLPFTAIANTGAGVVGYQNWASAVWSIHVQPTAVSMRVGPASQTLGNGTTAYAVFSYTTNA